MRPVESGRQTEIRHRQQLTHEIRELVRELRIQRALLNHRVSTQVDLRDVDLDCLDLITLHGPLSPTALARRAGLHPATITGILDRLEQGRWVARERDPADRRAVLIRALTEPNPVFRTQLLVSKRLAEGAIVVLARLCLLFAAAAAGAQLAALRAAGLKGVAPANAHGFSVLTATLTDNWVWIIITGLGLILTILAGLMIGGSRQAPDWLFKVIGGILVLLVGIPAVLA